MPDAVLLRPRSPLAICRATFAVALACATPFAFGANWFIETGVRTELTSTTNAGFGNGTTTGGAGQGDGDVVFAVAPTLTIRGEGGHLRVAGNFALAGVTYLRGTQDSAFVPTGDLTANWQAVERWLFIDAGITAARLLDNPLAPRPEGPSSANRLTTVTYRISPYIDRALPNDTRLVLRYDNAWTRESAATDVVNRGNIYAQRLTLQFSRDPRPFGWVVEATRSDQRGDVGTASDVPSFELARLRLRYAIDPQLAAGVRGGAEKSEAIDSGSTRSFAGAELSWRPSERTTLDAYGEHRSFGAGFQGAFRHRSPYIAWDLRASRDLTTSAQAAIEFPATGDLASLLNAALTTRIADPIERARAVENFITQRGLPRTLSGPFNLYADQLIIRTARSATVTWIGQRSTLALTAFNQQDVSPPGDVFSLIGGPLQNISQQGGSAVYSLRMSSLTAASLAGTWTRTVDVSGNTVGSTGFAGTSRQQSYRVQVDYRLAPRTTGFAGVRRQLFASTVQPDTQETAVFAGLAHRF